MFAKRKGTCKKVQQFPVIHANRVKGFKKRDSIKNVREETK